MLPLFTDCSMLTELIMPMMLESPVYYLPKTMKTTPGKHFLIVNFFIQYFSLNTYNYLIYHTCFLLQNSFILLKNAQLSSLNI